MQLHHSPLEAPPSSWWYWTYCLLSWCPVSPKCLIPAGIECMSPPAPGLLSTLLLCPLVHLYVHTCLFYSYMLQVIYLKRQKPNKFYMNINEEVMDENTSGSDVSIREFLLCRIVVDACDTRSQPASLLHLRINIPFLWKHFQFWS